MSSETYFNLSKAVEVTGVSRPTLIKHLKAGRLPNATQQKQGKVLVWQIPLTDLQPYLDRVSTPKSAPKAAETLSEGQELRAKVRELEIEIRGLRETLAEVRKTNDLLAALMPPQLETREAQQRRRWNWLRR